MTASTPLPCELPLYLIIKGGKIRLIKNWNIQDRCVPKDFESDLGSVPRPFWWLVKPNDITFASILHDYDWLEADFGRYSYKLGNRSFIKNALELDKIEKRKGYLCYGVLEIVRLYKWVKFKFLRSGMPSPLTRKAAEYTDRLL